MQDFLAFVAGLFKVDPSTLSPQTAYQSIPQWDSVMQLRLVMEMEDKYGVEIPLEMIPELKTLEMFYKLIAEEE